MFSLETTWSCFS